MSDYQELIIRICGSLPESISESDVIFNLPWGWTLELVWQNSILDLLWGWTLELVLKNSILRILLRSEDERRRKEGLWECLLRSWSGSQISRYASTLSWSEERKRGIGVNTLNYWNKGKMRSFSLISFWGAVEIEKCMD